MENNEPLEPQYLLARQIQVNGLNIEQNLRHLYNPDATPEQKQIALQYVYAQTRQIKELADALFGQYKTIERGRRK